MNKKRIDLNGEWNMAWCDIGTGVPENFSDMKQLPYHVPGDVHTPLIQAGLIAEPLYGMNSLECRWVEDKEFWCERRFILTRKNILTVTMLTFEGLDCTADIYVNGNYIGRHNNAFTEITFDVSKHLRIGENTLLVRIDQGLKEAQRHDLEKMGMMWNNEQPWRVWMRKPQFVYGWDWTIWLASCGIWKSVYMTTYDYAVITDMYVRAADSAEEGKPCRVAVSIETERYDETPYSIILRINDHNGNIAAIKKKTLSENAEELFITVPNAHLWWCNGMGEAYLYTVTAELKTIDGKLLDNRTQRFGLRTIELSEPELYNDEKSFTFVLNGVPVFCKGANHVPCDCLPGRITDEKEQQLIALARDEHINMLRVWGGGIYASEAFMNACDEAGIMVWHDFMYACGYYPDHDTEFVENITLEAIKAIHRLRRHTSLIGWAGNNEIQEMYYSQKQYTRDLPWYGGTIYEKLLPTLTRELCPTLIYRESSPFAGKHQADGRKGDQHIWMLTHVIDHPHYLDLWRFTEFKVKFLSEFGIMGAMTAETAESCIPPENMHPDDPVWLHHTNSTQNSTLLDSMVKKYFGDKEFTYRQYILHSQVIQAELTRHVYEEFRRQKFICSGLLFWTLSDSYGIHNWSLIDHGLRRKPVYFALKQAMSPLALCIRGWDVQNDEGYACWRKYWADNPDILEIWGMNDTRTDFEVSLEWCMVAINGEILLRGNQNVQLSANRSEHLADISVKDINFQPEQTVLRARLEANGKVINETKYFFAPFSQMVAENADVQVSYRPLDEEHYEVTLTSDRFVWLVNLEEYDEVMYDDNNFTLWANEPHTVIAASKKRDYKPILHWIKNDLMCKKAP